METVQIILLLIVPTLVTLLEGVFDDVPAFLMPVVVAVLGALAQFLAGLNPTTGTWEFVGIAVGIAFVQELLARLRQAAKFWFGAGQKLTTVRDLRR